MAVDRQHLDDAILGLLLLNVRNSDEARSILRMWSRVDELTEEQFEQVLREIERINADDWQAGWVAALCDHDD